jgi:hypothetical protein
MHMLERTEVRRRMKDEERKEVSKTIITHLGEEKRRDMMVGDLEAECFNSCSMRTCQASMKFQAMTKTLTNESVI